MSASRKVGRWQLPHRALHFGRLPLVMGIVNVTPDSFSDGGEFSDPQRAVEAALRMEAAGADIIDIGGESTRPYSDPVDAAEERQRVVPVIRSLVGQLRIPISVDTSKASVARAALAAGAEIINDVTGLEGDAEMLEVALESRAGVCVMHMRGTPQTMQDDPRYDDVVGEIHDYLRQRLQWCIEAGLDRARICLDPGIGFGKTHEHNQQLLQQVARFLDLEVPLLVGHSRKGFIAKAIGDKNADRTAGTLGVSLALALRGVHILRVHDVAFTVQGLRSFDYAGGFA